MAKKSDKKSTKEPEKIAEQIKQQFAERQYFRDTKNGILGGVIAGLAAYTGWDVTLLRVLFVFLILCTAFFPFGLLYLIVWISAPEAKTASDRRSMQGTPSQSDAATTTPAHSTTSAAPLVLRIVLACFGIIGLLTFIPMLVTLIPITVIAVFRIAAATIVYKPIFVAAAILLAILLFTIASIGITLSTALLTAKLNRAARTGLITSIIFALALTTATSVTGSIWIAKVSHDDIKDTVNQLIHSKDLHINIDDNRVIIDLGPIHINTRK